MGSWGLDRRDLLNQAMIDEAWYSKRWNHKQQRDMQEFLQQTPTQAAIPREKRVAMNKQRARKKII